ncbi:MAG: cytochrome c biogenesis protein CcsA [Chitinophagales bacterium]
MDIKYIGEWLWQGQLGHFFTLLSMVAAFVASVSFFMAAQNERKNLDQSNRWRNLARKSFYLHGFSVLSIFVLLFLLILNHRFEYKYVWQHSSTDLPIYYMISCFWEGQEGSFLLWTFWHAVLGFVIIAIAKEWENRVMSIMSLMQVFLAAMLIGLYFFEYKIGSSPFILLRETQPELPVFRTANYLMFEQFQEGTGLNPLLQNYWMVIHPPTLFLGFAACMLPFAYVLSALWRKDFTNFTLPTLRWTLFASAILGIGVLMGGAWAYESLSFGGFWAWDPVENASLVPWIALIAGLHTLLIYKSTGRALRATVILLITAQALLLYSTFLTRSGILGDTSVHSFTDLGMSGQLLVFIFSFFGLAAFLVIRGWKAMPTPLGKNGKPEEESIYSREFWMFVGALVMVMLAALITVDTSAPVINQIFGTNRVLVEPVEHYNAYSIWFGIFIALFSAMIQFLRYKSDKLHNFAKPLILSALIAAGLTAFIASALHMSHPTYLALLFTSIFAIIANSSYIFAVLRGKVKVAGASVSHIGFGLILLGVIISMSKQEVISLNTLGIKYGEDFDEENNRENILLYKNKAVQMGEYWVTYTGDSIAPPNTYYKVRYELKPNEADKAKEQFTLYPNAQVNPEMGLLANPDTRHYWSKDIFTHVSSVADKSEEKRGESLNQIKISVGDTIVTSGAFFILNGINPNPSNPQYFGLPGDIAAGATLDLLDITGAKHSIEPIYYIRENLENTVPIEVEALNLTVKFDKIFPEENSVQLSIIEKEGISDFIIMKAIVFPYINILWLGCIIMSIGFFMSLFQRRAEGKRRRKSRSNV